MIEVKDHRNTSLFSKLDGFRCREDLLIVFYGESSPKPAVFLYDLEESPNRSTLVPITPTSVDNHFTFWSCSKKVENPEVVTELSERCLNNVLLWRVEHSKLSWVHGEADATLGDVFCRPGEHWFNCSKPVFLEGRMGSKGDNMRPYAENRKPHLGRYLYKPYKVLDVFGGKLKHLIFVQGGKTHFSIGGDFPISGRAKKPNPRPCRMIGFPLILPLPLKPYRISHYTFALYGIMPPG